MQLFYFVSPMCSWCWGFAPVIQELKNSFPEDNIRVVLTPFRIDTDQPMDKALCGYVMGQWSNVYKTTGQAFDFNFSMPEDFIYNTRLACLSIKAFSKQLPHKELDYLHAIQHAFYTENKNLTDEAVLINIASNFLINEKRFTQDLSCGEVAKELALDFDLCQQLAVQSYPTLMAKDNDNYAVLASGYTSFEKLLTKIDTAAVPQRR